MVLLGGKKSVGSCVQFNNGIIFIHCKEQYISHTHFSIIIFSTIILMFIFVSAILCSV